MIKSLSRNNIDLKMLNFLNYSNGFYIEIGAYDGIQESNTLFFEKYKNWRGILVEPSEQYFKLIKNRNFNNFFFHKACVSFENTIKFQRFIYAGKTTISLDTENDIDNPEEWIKKKKYSKDKKITYKFKQKATNLNNILEFCKAPQEIDFFSLDVEGSEIEVLKGVNLDFYRFKNLLIEARDLQKICDFLKTKGYIYKNQLTIKDHLFVYNFL
jgi:FkbM family methyltransferase